MAEPKTVKLTVPREKTVRVPVSDSAVCSINGRRYRIAPGGILKVREDIARAIKSACPHVIDYVEPEKAKPAGEDRPGRRPEGV